MKAFRYCEATNEFELQEVGEIPKAGPGEALVKVVRAGICATDIHMLEGYKGGYKGTLGHELVGVVVHLQGTDPRIQVGDRVAPELNLPCDNCDFCKSGNKALRRNHCKRRVVLGIHNSSQGAFAEYIHYPVDLLYKIPPSIPDDVAVFIEPFAAAYRIVEQSIIAKTADKVAVIGDGKLGLLIALVLAMTLPKTCRVCAMGRHQSKLDIVKPYVHETVVVDDTTADTHDSSFDACVAATGSIKGLELAVKVVKPLGNLVLKSTCSARDTGDLLTTVNNAIVVKEIVVQGSRCGPFGEAIEVMEQHLDKIAPVLRQMTAKTFAFDQIKAALDHSRSRGVLKVVLNMVTPDIES